jgi:hypothetical protein
MKWFKFFVLFFSVLGIAVGYVTTFPEKFGSCHQIYSTDAYIGCLDSSAVTIGQPLFYFSIAFFSASLLAVLLPARAFVRWFWFAVVYVVTAAWLVSFAPTNHQALLALDITKLQSAEWLGGLFVLITLIYVIIQKRHEKKKSE